MIPQHFEKCEIDHRGQRLIEEMARRRLDFILLMDPCNYYYVTGFPIGVLKGTFGALVSADGNVFWIGRKTDMSNVKALIEADWSGDRHEIGAEIADDQDPYAAVGEAIERIAPHGTRIGFELAKAVIPPRGMTQIAAALPGREVVNAADLIEPMRAVKSAAELTYMRRSGQIAAEATRAALDGLLQGATEADLAADLIGHAIRAGAEPFSLEPFVCSGPRSALAHSTWTMAPLRPGTIINTELAPPVARYSAPLFRVSVIGPPGDDICRLHDASRAGLLAGLERIGPGMSCHDADAVVRETIARLGYARMFPVRAAYGVGINFAPDWSEENVASIRPGNQTLLEPGMCFHLVPALYQPGVGCACCSMTICITSDGVETLTPFEPELVVLHP
ncbi:Xaa-Pro peptidase family protein [Sulfitobacter sp. G21635-S1]|uniref:M24 family metallopeptidase n=1 Tax=Sulfitobacter sp. G21635-S1 TaxID=3014043 RepID=UPI0022AFC3CD|nr:Xaa-Pro peptidase family protein [Sulfitobacter sp. G21635-S1]MCZ4256654.1 Xaa-Pro peptidase family protein [Sulfitobacter sp. G21635-S1]